MTFNPHFRPAAVLGLTFAAVLATGCQSMNRPSTSGSSDASSGSTMGSSGSTSPTTTRRSGMGSGSWGAPANPATSTDQQYLGGDAGPAAGAGGASASAGSDSGSSYK